MGTSGVRLRDLQVWWSMGELRGRGGTFVSTWMQVCCVNMILHEWCMEHHMYVEHVCECECTPAGVLRVWLICVLYTGQSLNVEQIALGLSCVLEPGKVGLAGTGPAPPPPPHPG